MAKAYGRIFTGILFTFININFGPIDILPDFIGYLFAIKGLTDLYNETSIKNYKISYIIGWVLFVESLISAFYIKNNHIISLSTTLAVWMVISGLLRLVFVYFIYSASIELLEKGNNTELKDSIMSGRAVYVYTLMIILGIYTFIPNLDYGLRTFIIIVSVVSNFIIMIGFLINLNKLKKYYIHNEETRLSGDI